MEITSPPQKKPILAPILITIIIIVLVIIIATFFIFNKSVTEGTDLSIKKITVEKYFEALNISIQLKNKGTQEISAPVLFTLEVGSQTLEYTEQINIMPGETSTFNRIQFGQHDNEFPIKLTIDKNNELQDTNRENNVYEKTVIIES